MTLLRSVELSLLHRLLTSPFTRRRFWDERPVLALVAGDAAWEIRDRGIAPAADNPETSMASTDAVIRCAPEDLTAMAEGRVPAAVSYTLGDRPGAPRRKQARVVLALAALGWCGPWPDPTVDPEHIRLVRAAHHDLGIGPCDGVARLFAEGGPLPHVSVRLTQGAAGTELATVGLADTLGLPELTTIVPGRGDPRLGFPALRAGALAASEGVVLDGVFPVGDHVLRSAPHPRFPDGLALPNQLTRLLRVGWG